MKENKKAPGRARAKEEYLLSGKLFCGYCKEKMVGHGSNKLQSNGLPYRYYKCKTANTYKTCKKKLAKKDYIENIIVDECRKLLTPKNIQKIAKEVVKIAKSFDNKTELKRLEKLIKKAFEEKENQMTSLRACNTDTVRDMIIEDLERIGLEIVELEKQVELEKRKHAVVSETQVIDHFTRLANGNVNDIVYRRALIKTLVNKIFLYDDKFTITFNTGDEEVTITDKLLGEIEKGLNSKEFCLLNHAVHHSNT